MRRRAGVTSRGGRLRAGPGLAGLTLLGVLLLVGACAGDGPPRAVRPEFDLHDPDPRRRIDAVQEVRRRGERRWIPELIEMLDDRDETVRLVASGALRELTGRETGYRAFAPQAERRAQVRTWRDWYAGSGEAGTGARVVPDAVREPGP